MLTQHFSLGFLLNPTKMELIRCDNFNLGFQALVKLLDAELAIRDGKDHAFYHQFNGIDALKNVVVVLEGGLPVACGAFKKYSATQAEIKRMFTLSRARNKGLAKQVLSELELWAAELGYSAVILESGKAQVEALAFYPKNGYTITPNFSPYIGVENSVCFIKELKKA